ncbi:MAG: glycosyltransferase family 4 protein [Microgenomates group bacterium]
MKIALIAPLEESIPPTYYGGIEWIVYYLAHLLGKKGHTVDLYATGDSKREDEYTLIPIVDTGLRTTVPFIHNMKLRESAKWLGISSILYQINHNEYDIVHNHASWRMQAFGKHIKPPFVTTHHSSLTIDHQNAVYLANKDAFYVSISNNQRRDLPNLNYVKTIYNGTDLNEYPFAAQEKEYKHMAFLARMSPEKGGIEAAQVAQKTQKVLHIAAKVDEADKEYFAKFQPYIDNKFVYFMEEIGQNVKLKHLQTAKCLIAPIRWEEPFGLMFTEAMACGTPVVAYSRGSAPEIIKDGVTGFLVNESSEYLRGDWVIKKTGVDGLAEAVERIYAMSEQEYQTMRKNCHAHIEQNFTVEHMVDEYEKLYKEIITSSAKS